MPDLCSSILAGLADFLDSWAVRFADWLYGTYNARSDDSKSSDMFHAVVLLTALVGLALFGQLQ